MSNLEEYDQPRDMRGTRPSGGIYDLPVVGAGFRETREFFDEMRPQPDDAPGIVAGKQVIRYGAVAGTTAAGLAVGCVLVL